MATLPPEDRNETTTVRPVHASTCPPDGCRLPVALFLEQREDFAAQVGAPGLHQALHVDQQAAVFAVRVARHEVLHP